MEVSSKAKKDDINVQIRECYGKLVYSYTAHIKEAKILENKNNVLKISQIVLSAISTCGIVAVILEFQPFLCGIISAILTTSNLIISTYLKAKNFDEKIISHINTSNNLWLLREKFISLMTDMKYLEYDEIKAKRDMYIENLNEIYKSQLMTSDKAYKLTQESLKNNEEQYFSDEELDVLLPKHLRKCK